MYDIVYAFRIETHHVVSGQIRMDIYVGQSLVILVDRPAEHIYALTDDVADVVYLIVLLPVGGDFHSYDYVSTEIPGHGRRIIVPHAPVHKHHPVHLYRSEYPRYGHGGAHGRGEMSAEPVFGGPADHFRSHAHERDRQGSKTDTILIPDRQAVYQIVHILPENIARRKAAEQVIHDKVLGRPRIGAEIYKFVMTFRVHILHLILEEGLVISGIVIERNGQNIFLPVFRLGI